MATFVRIALLSLLLVVPARPEAPDAADTPPFLVAALRRDGIVIPFASFDGKYWRAPWPLDVEPKERPATLDAVPRTWWGKTGPLSQLTAWVNGVSRGVIHLHLGKPAVLRVMCDTRMALATDYRSAEPMPPAAAQPFPKDGLAVSGAQRVDPIQIVAPESPEWTAAMREMTVDFDAAEERAAASFTDWKHPFSKVERRRFRPQIEAMYGAPMDEAGWIAYYLEAVRLYPPGPQDRGCGLITSASGWMAVGPNGKRSFNLRARITYCDREGVRYMLPLGSIKARERSYWAYQMSGYGNESYVIVRPHQKEILTELSYPAGNCPVVMSRDANQGFSP
jgi:hypothetical protein